MCVGSVNYNAKNCGFFTLTVVDHRFNITFPAWIRITQSDCEGHLEKYRMSKKISLSRNFKLVRVWKCRIVLGTSSLPHGLQWRIYIVKFWTPPPGVQILSISCSFWENLAKSYVGAPPLKSWRPLLGEILDPPLVCVCCCSFIKLRAWFLFSTSLWLHSILVCAMKLRISRQTNTQSHNSCIF